MRAVAIGNTSYSTRQLTQWQSIQANNHLPSLEPDTFVKLTFGDKQSDADKKREEELRQISIWQRVLGNKYDATKDVAASDKRHKDNLEGEEDKDSRHQPKGPSLKLSPNADQKGKGKGKKHD